MTEKIDAEANLAARQKEVEEHSLREGLDIQITEILERRKCPEDDVPPSVVLEAFRQDYPPPAIIDDPETFVQPLEGHNLPLTDATQIVGDLTKYDYEHVYRQHALGSIKARFGELQRGEGKTQWDKGRPCVTIYGRLNLYDLQWIHKSDPRIIGVKKDYEGNPNSTYDCPNHVYYSDPSTWPPLQDVEDT